MKKKIYFWQPAHYTYFQGDKTYWFPYSVGCLWAFALTRPKIVDNYELGEFFFQREPVDKVLERMEDPHIAVFSCYLWNWQYTKTIAKAVREKFPKCIIIFGGPQVTKYPEEKKFFENHPYVDYIVNGEGEVIFAEFLENLVDGIKPEKVMKFSRLTDVSYPSPYSGGVFNTIVKKYPEYYWMATLETNRGCPYQCTFCDWGSATYSKIVKINEQRVIDDITWMSDNKVNYVVIADANFGMLHERDTKFAQYMNHCQQTKGFPKIILAQWAKNGKERILDIAKIFFNGYNRGFTLSVQSMEDQVLEAIKRKNMETSNMAKMLELCKERGINAYTEMLLGLPYETRETWRNNFYKLLELGQHSSADVWMVQLLENSALNSKESHEEHEIKFVEVPKLVTGYSAEEQDIPETENIIVSTKYMPSQDFIDSYLFSFIMLNFHYFIGATNFLSRFLAKHKNIPYSDFYSHLEKRIRDKDTYLYEPYARLNRFLDLLTQGRILETEPELMHNAHASIFMVGKDYLRNLDKMLEDIFTIFTKEWCQLDDKMYNQLVDFQKNLVYNYFEKDKTYPIVKKYDYDFYGFLEKGTALENPTVATFEYNKTYKDEKHFMELAYHERRTREIINTKYKQQNEN